MSRRVETLTEWGKRRIELSDSAMRALAGVAGDALTVSPCPDPGVYEVGASAHVGTVVLPGLEVLIRPKIPLDNLFGMLDVGLPPEAWRRETFEYGTSRDLLPAFASFFVRCVDRAVARGLVRAYRGTQERLQAIRGRIDFPALLRAPDRVAPVPCAFDEYTADILENRILYAALRRLLRIAGLPAATRRSLLRLSTRFEDVAAMELRPEVVDSLHLTRLNDHYRPALQLARLALGGTSLRDRAGEAAASSFLVDMNDLFQRFVESRLRRLLRGRLEVVSEPTVWLGIGRKVQMLPDLVFQTRGVTAYVADVKYKITETGRGRNDDYYQLLAYATALRLPEGALIYCSDSANAEPRVLEVRHAGIRLHTFPVRAAGPVASLEASLMELAEWISDRVAHADANAGTPVLMPSTAS